MELRSRMLGGHPESVAFAPSRMRQAIGVPRETGSGAAAPAKGPPPCWRTATKKIATYNQGRTAHETEMDAKMDTQR